MSHLSELTIRIYYEDTDAQDVVYHSRYINFGERGRMEYLRDLGFEIPDLLNDLGIYFIVRHAEIDYKAPARFNDLITLKTHVENVRNSSFTAVHDFYKNGDLIVHLKVTIVCVDANTFKPLRVPDLVRNKMIKG